MKQTVASLREGTDNGNVQESISNAVPESAGTSAPELLDHDRADHSDPAITDLPLRKAIKAFLLYTRPTRISYSSRLHQLMTRFKIWDPATG
jgi:hypothetical protein